MVARTRLIVTLSYMVGLVIFRKGVTFYGSCGHANRYETKIQVFWDVMPCLMANGYGSFEEISPSTSGSNSRTWFMLLGMFIMKKAPRSFETSMTIHQSTGCNTADGLNLKS